MTMKPETPAASGRPAGQPPPRPFHPSPLTAEEQLLAIEALAKRISGHVQFMCQVGNLNGVSSEAKDKALAAFCERLTALERQLARIQESLQLG
jgi:hypothetical protein